MAGRIGRAFEAARQVPRGAFIPYLTSGFPSVDESDRLASALCEEEADVLELGVPFSDPLADGPVIQRATQTALEAGVTLAHVLAQAKRLRTRHETPLVLMTYLNPVVRYGPSRFADQARDAGVDGVILVDLPPEEEPGLWEGLRKSGLDTIALVAPTTAPQRVEKIAAQARGFLYVVARLGVTGSGAADPAIAEMLRVCRDHSPLPRCLGFGIGRGNDLGAWRGLAEGVIVGSALLEELLRAPDSAVREAKAREFARHIRGKLSDLAPS
ncbi:MAG TPA: tryptophan synthase subunit alpha [Candidatus Eisenbacteria bacterium]|nr:tryptophan synthase subunit alpha [Candidatus Eisenbacteria bacterium]